MSHGYTPSLALRALLLGARNPRRAMREALAVGLGEPGRLGLIVAAAAGTELSDPAADGTRSTLVEAVRATVSPAEAVREVGLWAGAALAAIGGLYLVLSGLIWLATRPAEAAPSFSTIRSALAIGSWLALLPTILLSLVFYALGIEILGGLVLIALGAAFVGLCLSEASSLSASAAMGIVMGSFLLAGLGLAAGLVGAVLPLLLDVTSTTNPEVAP